mmetsp:Transcript_14839/g.40809  ORF Transcript_14839/g.40809 Transcript_14839/m.40809 type:complete len:1296 (-) Transcript_14839:115-4002(-)
MSNGERWRDRTSSKSRSETSTTEPDSSGRERAQLAAARIGRQLVNELEDLASRLGVDSTPKTVPETSPVETIRKKPPKSESCAIAGPSITDFSHWVINSLARGEDPARLASFVANTTTVDTDRLQCELRRLAQEKVAADARRHDPGSDDVMGTMPLGAGNYPSSQKSMEKQMERLRAENARLQAELVERAAEAFTKRALDALGSVSTTDDGRHTKVKLPVGPDTSSLWTARTSAAQESAVETPQKVATTNSGGSRGVASSRVFEGTPQSDKSQSTTAYSARGTCCRVAHDFACKVENKSFELAAGDVRGASAARLCHRTPKSGNDAIAVRELDSVDHSSVKPMHRPQVLQRSSSAPPGRIADSALFTVPQSSLGAAVSGSTANGSALVPMSGAFTTALSPSVVQVRTTLPLPCTTTITTMPVVMRCASAPSIRTKLPSAPFASSHTHVGSPVAIAATRVSPVTTYQQAAPTTRTMPLPPTQVPRAATPPPPAPAARCLSPQPDSTPTRRLTSAYPLPNQLCYARLGAGLPGIAGKVSLPPSTSNLSPHGVATAPPREPVVFGTLGVLQSADTSSSVATEPGIHATSGSQFRADTFSKAVAPEKFVSRADGGGCTRRVIAESSLSQEVTCRRSLASDALLGDLAARSSSQRRLSTADQSAAEHTSQHAARKLPTGGLSRERTPPPVSRELSSPVCSDQTAQPRPTTGPTSRSSSVRRHSATEEFTTPVAHSGDARRSSLSALGDQSAPSHSRRLSTGSKSNDHPHLRITGRLPPADVASGERTPPSTSPLLNLLSEDLTPQASVARRSSTTEISGDRSAPSSTAELSGPRYLPRAVFGDDVQSTASRRLSLCPVLGEMPRPPTVKRAEESTGDRVQSAHHSTWTQTADVSPTERAASSSSQKVSATIPNAEDRASLCGAFPRSSPGCGSEESGSRSCGVRRLPTADPCPGDQTNQSSVARRKSTGDTPTVDGTTRSSSTRKLPVASEVSEKLVKESSGVRSVPPAGPASGSETGLRGNSVRTSGDHVPHSSAARKVSAARLPSGDSAPRASSMRRREDSASELPSDAGPGDSFKSSGRPPDLPSGGVAGLSRLQLSKTLPPPSSEDAGGDLVFSLSSGSRSGTDTGRPLAQSSTGATSGASGRVRTPPPRGHRPVSSDAQRSKPSPAGSDAGSTRTLPGPPVAGKPPPEALSGGSVRLPQPPPNGRRTPPPETRRRPSASGVTPKSDKHTPTAVTSNKNGRRTPPPPSTTPPAPARDGAGKTDASSHASSFHTTPPAAQHMAGAFGQGLEARRIRP